MLEPEGKVGIREFVALAVIMTGAKITDDTPVIFITGLDTAAWMSPFFLSLFIGLPTLMMFKVQSKFDTTSFAEYMNQLFGKVLTVIILLFIWVVFSYTIVLDSAKYTDIISTMYFPETTPLWIYVVLMGVCAYVGKKGIENIGSISWVLFPIINAAFLIALVLGIMQGTSEFLFPIFGSGEIEIIKESFLRGSVQFDLLLLFVVIPFVSSLKGFKKGTLIAVSILIVEITFAFIAFIVIFDFETAKLISYPYHELLRFIHLGSLQNIETIFFPFWLVVPFIRISIYLFISAYIFGQIFNIKHFEYLIPIFAYIIIFIGLIPDYPTLTLYHIRDKLMIYMTPFVYIFPFLLWTAAKLKEKKNHDIQPKS